MAKPLENHPFLFEIRAEQNERGNIITGRPIVYESVTDLGWFDEVIERGALDGADLTDVRFLVNHDLKKIPLARSRRNNGNSTPSGQPHGFPATTITIDNTTAPGFKLKKALKIYFRGYKQSLQADYAAQPQEILTAFMSSGDSVRVKLQGSFIDNNNSVYRRQATLTYTKTGDDESLEVAFDVCSNGSNTNNEYIIPLYITTVDYELDSLVSLS